MSQLEDATAPWSSWYDRRTSCAADWPVEALLAAKGSQRVSVVLPALDEEAAVGGVVAVVVGLREAGLVDEVVVMDSGSTDRTAEVAAAAGASVHHRDAVLPEVGSVPGKGEVLWKSLACTSGDVVVFVDADLLDPAPELVTGLLGPLLTDPGVQLVKGLYSRPLAGVADGDGGSSGGRVTELVARPLLQRLVPELGGVVQPLGGEYAGRRELLERLPFVSGYGVEVGLLIDAVRLVGLDALAQVDLGRRVHSHQSTAALGRMAAQVAATVLGRAEVVHAAPTAAEGRASLTQFRRGASGRWEPEAHDVSLSERPPMRAVLEGLAAPVAPAPAAPPLRARSRRRRTARRRAS
ncbi:glucosyl-3-phosphoglycerate synthase [uncultured Pseudokineococcus sp.]|uniref:glucosyl-3-phosphoglycerate synthase n=1 Tax=uncultured Pseudokineococcus sp. TaxID=1642928 RepID=UPI0026246A4D|nr:glucosyl-3-phosphoglycerate synthase [uncultured Pseudokineococcus sp.]